MELTQGAIVLCRCTWLGDIWTLIMVWDSMLQDTTSYPEWATTLKPCWARCRVCAANVLGTLYIDLIYTDIRMLVPRHCPNCDLLLSDYLKRRR